MTASHLALDDFSWNLHTNVSLFKSCPWDPLSHPIFPWRAFELLVATSFLLTDGSRGSTRNMGNAFLFHLFPPQQCGSLQWGTLGGATTTPKTSCIPRTQAAPICQLQHREHNQDPKRTRSPNVVTADGILGEKHLPSSRTSWLGKQLGFFQKDSSHILPCCWIFAQISALTDELLVHALKHITIETTDRLYLTWAKNPMLWTAWPRYSEVNESGFCLNCNVTAPKGAQKSVRHIHLQGSTENSRWNRLTKL